MGIAKLVFLIAGSAVFFIAGSWVRAVEPTELPVLHLAPRLIEKVRAQTKTNLGRAKGNAVARALTQIVCEQGLAELGQGRAPVEWEKQKAMRLKVLRDAQRTGMLDVARDQAVGALFSVWQGKGPDERQQELLGTFEKNLDRYQLRLHEKIPTTQFVVRTLYKARWNAIVGLPLTEGFSPFELRAYWGWLGLHSDRIGASIRDIALERYAATGGDNVAEARAVLAFGDGHTADAFTYLKEVCVPAGCEYRIRNYMMALTSNAGSPPR